MHWIGNVNDCIFKHENDVEHPLIIDHWLLRGELRERDAVGGLSQILAVLCILSISIFRINTVLIPKMKYMNLIF